MKLIHNIPNHLKDKKDYLLNLKDSIDKLVVCIKCKGYGHHAKECGKKENNGHHAKSNFDRIKKLIPRSK